MPVTDQLNLDQIDRDLINDLQRGFPISDSPFQEVADRYGITEQDVLDRLARMKEDRLMSRFGPMYHAERLGGTLSLAALSVPVDRFEEVTEQVNRHPEVAHNYARQHALNMWFVLACDKPGQEADVIREIEQETGLTVFNMPKIHEFFVGLHFEV